MLEKKKNENHFLTFITSSFNCSSQSFFLHEDQLHMLSVLILRHILLAPWASFFLLFPQVHGHFEGFLICLFCAAHRTESECPSCEVNFRLLLYYCRSTAQ